MLNNKFLDSYRALDIELKSEGKTVLDYENTLESTELEKLKVCRIMRNYMSHNDMTFLEATNEQIKFIDSQVDYLRSLSHTVKDEMKRIKLVKSTEWIKNIIPLVDKNKIIPIETSNGIFLVDSNYLIHQLSLGNKKLSFPNRPPKYDYVNKLDKIEDLNKNHTYIVTDTGTKDGKYLGILNLS